MAVPVIVGSQPFVSGATITFIEVTGVGPVTAGNTLIALMAAGNAVTSRTYTVTDTPGGGGWVNALTYTPDRGGCVFHRHNFPGGTTFVRMTQNTSTFSGTLQIIEVSGLDPAGTRTTATLNESPTLADAHNCTPANVPGTDVFVACFGALNGAATTTVCGTAAGYTTGFTASTRIGQFKAVASTNDRGPWASTGTDRYAMSGMVLYPAPITSGDTQQRMALLL